jgi:hypothetical protein
MLRLSASWALEQQLHTVIVNRDFGSPDAVVILVSTHDMKRTGNLDYVMGDAKSWQRLSSRHPG